MIPHTIPPEVLYYYDSVPRLRIEIPICKNLDINNKGIVKVREDEEW